MCSINYLKFCCLDLLKKQLNLSVNSNISVAMISQGNFHTGGKKGNKL